MTHSSYARRRASGSGPCWPKRQLSHDYHDYILGIPFRLIEPKPAKRIIKAYSDNFAANRKIPWTH